jgi:hypothetical protein
MAERFEFTPADLEDRFADHYALAQSYVEALNKEFGVEAHIRARTHKRDSIAGVSVIHRLRQESIDES